MNLKKILFTIGAGLILSNMTSCKKDDDTVPCTDQTLAAFNLALEDENENLLFDDEEYDVDNLKFVAIDDDEVSELDFEIKKTSADVNYLTSTEISEMSLEDGVNQFELRNGDETVASLTYNVTSSNASGCKVFTYSAKNGDDNLKTITSGNVKIYVYTVETNEEVE
jgi:hypothetical protein